MQDFPGQRHDDLFRTAKPGETDSEARRAGRSILSSSSLKSQCDLDDPILAKGLNPFSRVPALAQGARICPFSKASATKRREAPTPSERLSGSHYTFERANSRFGPLRLRSGVLEVCELITQLGKFAADRRAFITILEEPKVQNWQPRLDELRQTPEYQVIAQRYEILARTGGSGCRL